MTKPPKNYDTLNLIDLFRHSHAPECQFVSQSSICSQNIFTQCSSAFSLEMNPYGAFRLLMEPHAVTQGFLIFQTVRNIILPSMVKKTPSDTDAYV